MSKESNRHFLTDREVENAVGASIARSNARRQKHEPLSKRDVIISRIAVGAGIAGVALATGAPAKIEGGIDRAARALLSKGNAPALVSSPNGVPKATMDYLKSLPTERTEIPQGGGIDDAAYAVDPETFDESANLRDGVEEIIADEVRPPGIGDQNFVVPVHAKVDVPVVPPLNSVPPEAR